MRTGLSKFLAVFAIAVMLPLRALAQQQPAPPYGPWFMWADWSFWWICPLMMIVMILVMMAACRFMCSWRGHGDRHP